MSNKDYTKYAKASAEVVEEPIEIIDKPDPEEIEMPVPSAESEPGVISEEPVEEPELEAPQPKIGRVYGCTKLNVRKEPSSDADVVCTIFCHAEVEIDEEKSTSEFYKVCTTSGIQGFCMKSYILEK